MRAQEPRPARLRPCLGLCCRRRACQLQAPVAGQAVHRRRLPRRAAPQLHRAQPHQPLPDLRAEQLLRAASNLRHSGRIRVLEGRSRTAAPAQVRSQHPGAAHTHCHVHIPAVGYLMHTCLPPVLATAVHSNAWWVRTASGTSRCVSASSRASSWQRPTTCAAPAGGRGRHPAASRRRACLVSTMLQGPANPLPGCWPRQAHGGQGMAMPAAAASRHAAKATLEAHHGIKGSLHERAPLGPAPAPPLVRQLSPGTSGTGGPAGRCWRGRLPAP